MGDLLTFKKMISPILIQVLFWIGIVAVVIAALGAIFSGEFLSGLLMLLIGPLIVRLYAEIFIVMFKINDGVQELVKKK